MILIYQKAFNQPVNSQISINYISKEWSKAGVENGIPESNKIKVKKTINQGDNIQKSLDELAKLGGGVLLLKSGRYPVNVTLNIPSGVILKGIQRDSVLLAVNIHGYHFTTGKPRQSALHLENVNKAGIENLTIKYTGASFEPLDKDSMNAPWDKAVFHIRELRDTSLFVEHIWIDNSKNCWIRNCKILWAGSDPIRITNSQHITCTGNYIDRSYNKCDGGMGYYNIINSKYVLVYNEFIKRIRHFAIQNGSTYNVIFNNYMEVDINFHDGDGGFNLIEQNTIKIPQWHSWHCFQRGDPNQHQPPGNYNLLYKNVAHYKNGELEFSDPGKVYTINPDFKGKRVIESKLRATSGKTFWVSKINQN